MSLRRQLNRLTTHLRDWVAAIDRAFYDAWGVHLITSHGGAWRWGQ